MKTWSEQITYILRQSVKSLTSWHWLLVKAAASLEYGMPRQHMRAVSPYLEIPLTSSVFLRGDERWEASGFNSEMIHSLNSGFSHFSRWNVCLKKRLKLWKAVNSKKKKKTQVFIRNRPNVQYND